MKQKTPTSWGTVKWRGGPGHQGQKGGWGSECRWCLEMYKLPAAISKEHADVALYNHVVDHHKIKDEVKQHLLHEKLQ